jgi:hypothetical protein
VRLSRKGKGIPPAASSTEQQAAAADNEVVLPRRGKGYVRPPSEETTFKRQLGSSAPVSSVTAGRRCEVQVLCNPGWF